MIVLGLGSNLGEREQNIVKAISMLQNAGPIFIDSISSFYETEPVGIKDQPSFINAVISITTTLPPVELLGVCLAVEQQMGRVRHERWGARNIDIDLLLYHDIKIDSSKLILPHPRFHLRKFVLVPLAEIAGTDVVYNGMTAMDFLQKCLDTSEVRLFKKSLIPVASAQVLEKQYE